MLTFRALLALMALVILPLPSCTPSTHSTHSEQSTQSPLTLGQGKDREVILQLLAERSLIDPEHLVFLAHTQTIRQGQVDWLVIEAIQGSREPKQLGYPAIEPDWMLSCFLIAASSGSVLPVELNAELAKLPREQAPPYCYWNDHSTSQLAQTRKAVLESQASQFPKGPSESTITDRDRILQVLTSSDGAFPTSDYSISDCFIVGSAEYAGGSVPVIGLTGGVVYDREDFPGKAIFWNAFAVLDSGEVDFLGPRMGMTPLCIDGGQLWTVDYAPWGEDKGIFELSAQALRVSVDSTQPKR